MAGQQTGESGILSGSGPGLNDQFEIGKVRVSRRPDPNGELLLKALPVAAASAQCQLLPATRATSRDRDLEKKSAPPTELAATLAQRLTAWLPAGRGRPVSPSRQPIRWLLVVAAVYIVLLNLSQWAELRHRRWPIWAAPARWLRLDQRWTMFAPKPLEEDGWFVIDAVDGKGRGRPLSWTKPARVADDFPNSRWRKYLMNLYSPELAAWRAHYVRYLLNSGHGEDEHITRFTWYFLME